MAEDTNPNNDEGMSTPKKVVTGAAVGLATAAAVGVGKKLLSDDSGDEDQGSRGRQSGSRGSASRSRSTTRSGSSSRSRSGSSSTRKRSTSTGSKRSGTSSSARSRSSTARRSRSSSSRRSSSSSSSRSSGRTKEQLYAQATRLKIDGRSKMTKAQLERAIQRKRS